MAKRWLFLVLIATGLWSCQTRNVEDKEVARAMRELNDGGGSETLRGMLKDAMLRWEQVAVNLANEHTAGYRRVMVERPRTGDDPLRDMSMGTIVRTPRSLDVAVIGEGFFKVLRADGNEPAYTRAGAFCISKEGRLMLEIGAGKWDLQPAIVVPANAVGVTISTEGRVYASVEASTQPACIGQMQLAMFREPERLRSADGVLFMASSASGEAVMENPGTAGRGHLMQGALEESNVQGAIEIIRAERISSRVNALKHALQTTQ